MFVLCYEGLLLLQETLHLYADQPGVMKVYYSFFLFLFVCLFVLCYEGLLLFFLFFFVCFFLYADQPGVMKVYYSFFLFFLVFFVVGVFGCTN